jgi:hypothetical protein
VAEPFPNANRIGGICARVEGLLDVLEDRPLPEHHRCRSEERLAQPARELAHHATGWHHRLQEGSDDLVAYFVGGAIGTQEPVNNPLACARFSNPAQDPVCL